MTIPPSFPPQMNTSMVIEEEHKESSSSKPSRGVRWKEDLEEVHMIQNIHQQQSNSNNAMNPKKGSYKKQKKDHGILHEIEGEEDESPDASSSNGTGLMTAFNLKEENEQGHYDASGNFIWNKEDAVIRQEDAWLEVSDKQIHGAFQAQQAKLQQENMQEEDVLTQTQAIDHIYRILKDNETVLRALKRLGNQPQRQKRKYNRGLKKSEVPVVQVSEEEKAGKKVQFDQLTEAADYMMRKGIVDVYQLNKEEVGKLQSGVLQEEPATGSSTSSYFKNTTMPSAEEEEDGMKWEYKGKDGKVYGPYSTKQIVSWRQEGYFTGVSSVLMRRVGEKATGSSSSTTTTEEERTLTAEEELVRDMEDSDEEEETKQQEDLWINSDEIDFHQKK